MDEEFVIIISLLGTIILVAIIITIVYVLKSPNERGDYKDGGGKQIGGIERIRFFTPANDKAGLRGERYVNNHLRTLLREDEYLLANVLLPLRNGYDAEIDCVLISRKGLYCIEIKNWVGHIEGSDDEEIWLQKYDDPYRANREHKNPVKQNEAHCEILERRLHNKFYVNNAVVFPIIEYNHIESDFVYTLSEFKTYFRMLEDNHLSLNEIQQIYHVLVPYVASEEQMKRHREEIKKRFE